MIFDFSHLSPSSEKQLICSMFFCSLKNSTIVSGGFLFFKIYLSSGKIFLYSNGNKFIKKLNLSKSPYFSLIGNLASSYLSLLISINPECCPNPKSNLLEIYFFVLNCTHQKDKKKIKGYNQDFQ